ncbi:MAG: exosome complex RNA-binding protein Csl4 [Methanophagales archaeon]|nr:exosome complex RNA-binding protein Csl4 [Methanophagales archaeon]
MEKEKGIVVPGDFLGTSEEFTPGKGVYDENGNICSLLTGVVSISDKRVIEVQSKVETPPVLKEGDVVIGKIEDIKDTVAIVSIACLKGKEDREIATARQAVIHISNVKSGYVNELKNELCHFDVVKAKVIDAKNLRLSTEEKSLGVIKAICKRCKGGLKWKGNGNVLECGLCQQREVRKLSEDYGKGIV